MGVGYVSVMIIFASVCLTVFAVLSYRAAVSNDSFNRRSGDYLAQYYAADSKAKEILAKLDGMAYSARRSGFFEDSFEAASEELEGISLSRVRGGLSVEYSVTINEKQKLLVNVVFLESGGYDISLWQSKTFSSDESDSHINVWDGNTL